MTIHLTDTTTIAAIATPVGIGGIGIIRISGPEALPIAQNLFRRSPDNSTPFSGSEPLSHRMYHGYIMDPETGRMADEVMLVFMRAPRSYTREDVVEIQTHAGPAVLRTVLELVFRHGARLAEPGEFTRRAFLNGRIDLTQAEAVADMTRVHADQSLRIAASLIRGELKTQIEHIRADLFRVLAGTEAAIDFPEDVGETITAEQLAGILRNTVMEPLAALASHYENAHILRDGLKMVVAGRPNVGKSSLMNRLLKKERSIVTEIPGTTRDTIEEHLMIRGVSVVMTDTAGLHESDDPVEKIGIERARERIREADLVLFMTDGSKPLTPEDIRIHEDVRNQQVIRVINKADLMDEQEWPDTPEDWAAMPRVRISAKYGQGIGQLREMIADIALKDALRPENTIVPNMRHQKLIEAALDSLEKAATGLDNDMPFELVNMDIREAFDLLGEIIGVTIREDVLDEIFSTFCIGK